MEPTRELIESIDRERIARARAMPPEEKLLAGARLFDRACRIMCDGIRNEFPDATEALVAAILIERLALIRKLEETW